MPAKGQKIMDEKYLEMLAKAREKANAVRKAKADDKKKIKLAEQLEHHEKLAKADEKIKKAVNKPAEPAPAPVVAEKPKKKKAPAPKPEPETDSGSEDEDESGSEEEVSSPPPPKPKTKAPAKPQAQAQAQAPKQMTAAQHRMLMAFKSLYQ